MRPSHPLIQVTVAVAGALFFHAGFFAHAAAPGTQTPTSLTCPPAIPISSPPESGPNSWTIYVASELHLNSAAPTGGPPQMRADLSDYTSKTGKKQWSYTYDLDRDFPDGKWLECGYGSHNEITLSRRMPDTIKSCTFVYRKGAKAGQHDITIDCR